MYTVTYFLNYKTVENQKYMYVHVKRFCIAGKTLESNIKKNPYHAIFDIRADTCNGHKQKLAPFHLLMAFW